jgi:hypothetical protein
MKDKQYTQVLTTDLVAELDELNIAYPLAYDWRELITVSVIDEILEDFQAVDNYLAGNEGEFNKTASREYRDQALWAGSDIDYVGWASQRVADLAEGELFIDTEEQHEHCESVFEFGTCAIYKHLRTNRIRRIRENTPGDAWYDAEGTRRDAPIAA